MVEEFAFDDFTELHMDFRIVQLAGPICQVFLESLAGLFREENVELVASSAEQVIYSTFKTTYRVREVLVENGGEWAFLCWWMFVI